MRLDQTRPFLHSPRWTTLNAHSDDVKAMLGLPKKLPKEGVPPRIVQGIKVWVEPAAAAVYVMRWGQRKLLKRSTHRVMAECPLCGAHLSAGRLHQHKCQSSTSKEI